MSETTSKKKGLGRGLSHLFGEAEAAYRGPDSADTDAGRCARRCRAENSAHRLPPAGPVSAAPPFRRGGARGTGNLDQAAWLASAILVRPIEGERDSYEIVAGERRWRAAQKAALHEAPVIVQALSDTQALEIALVENLQRQDLTALEEAQGYQRLIDEFGHSHAALGQLVSKSRSHIANMLRLLALPSR